MSGSLTSAPQNATPWARIAVVWLVLCAILVLTGLSNILDRQFPDPDDTLRLVQVRDLLAGQGWFDIHQYRIDPPNGTLMHWSRIVDVPLAAFIVLLAPIAGQSGAENAALLIVPLCTFGLILLVIGFVAARFFDAEIVGLACLACGLLPALVMQVQPMRIDHHGWQIACVALSLLALVASSPRRGGWLAGLALATGLSISIELLPFTAGFAAVMFLRWLADREQRWWLAHFMTGLAVGLAGLFALTHSLGDSLAVWCDAISLVHVGFFSLVAAGVWAIASADPKSRAILIACFAIVGLAGLGMFAVVAPACLASPFSTLDPLVQKLWYANVAEGLPFWAQDPAVWVPAILQALVALIIGMHLWRTCEDRHRAFWFAYMGLFVTALLGGLLVWRSMAFVGVFCAIPLAWLAAQLFRKMRASPRVLGQMATAIVVAILLMPSLGVMAVQAALPRAANGPTSSAVGPIKKSGCHLNRSAALLNHFAPQKIFAPFDIGPALIEQTRHSVVATGHHRANLALRDVILAFTSDERAARNIVKRHAAGFIVVCTDLVEPQLYAANAPSGLMADLRSGKIPQWLKEVDVGGPTTFKVWRVID